VVTPDRELLGVTNAWTWAREFKAADGTRPGALESMRWIESYERVAEQALRLGQTRHVCVCDRESDIMALLVRARELNHAADYLVRSQHNRALPEDGKLWEKVGQAPVLGCVRFELPAGRGRKARSVQQQVRIERVMLKDSAKVELEVTCVMAAEIDAPARASSRWSGAC
jgi:hypothetical protein